MQVERVSSGNHIVAVMGPTGSGKSTFIATASRKGHDAIGHGLRAVSSDIQIVKASHPADHHSVVFLDTPSFDASSNSGIEILCQISDWLKSHGNNSNLAAIIYLHRISDNRMSGSLLRNLHIFASLCGQQAMPHVTIVTTMWGEVPEETGARREKELEKVFWGDMVGNGCKTKRFEDTFESAWGIIGRNSGIALRLQEVSHVDDVRKDGFSNWMTFFKEAVHKALLRSQTAITFTHISATQSSHANTHHPARLPPRNLISVPRSVGDERRRVAGKGCKAN